MPKNKVRRSSVSNSSCRNFFVLLVTAVFSCFSSYDAIATISNKQSKRAHPSASIIIMSRVSGAAESLEDMLSHSIVVIGKVTAVHRSAHTPYTNPGPEQHTVFKFQVQDYIKDETKERKRFLLVRQNMGDLFWTLNGQAGIGLRIVGEPLLEIGQKYILFLRKVAGKSIQGFHRATINGYNGVSGEVGECIIPAGEFGQFPIRNGVVTFAHTLEGPKVPPYMFPKGPQIIGVSESKAVRTILGELKSKEEKEIERSTKSAQRKRRPPSSRS